MENIAVICIKCGDSFIRLESEIRSYKYICPHCMTEYKKQWEAKNPDRVKSYRVRYISEHPEDAKAAKKKYRILHPKDKRKLRANDFIRRALKRGDINKADTCEYCSKKGKTQAHHPDYSIPSKIIWLCATCHKNIHLNNPKIGDAHAMSSL